MQTVLIFNRSRPKACCLVWSKLKWKGIAGPFELLVLDIGRNSNFYFVVNYFVEHASIALLFASCALVLASVNCLMLATHSNPLLSKSWPQNDFHLVILYSLFNH